MKRVKARKDEISARSNRGVEQWSRGLETCTMIQSHARFVSSHSIAVNDEVLEADNIFINVGGHATVPPFPGIDDVAFLTNSSMMDVDFVAEHLVIVGGSYIGLEFGQMYRHFGSDVTIGEMGPRLIGRENEKCFRSRAEDPGVEGDSNSAECEMDLAGDAQKPHRRANGMHGRCAGCIRHSRSSRRGAHSQYPRPGTRSGRSCNRPTRYILVDDQLQTNVNGIWALGDCNVRGLFTHTS
jgi:pyruvate/2-oxoglutarate dehydrogenase complex dihydrolipoamide dehydrogenase (E3) component